MKKRIFRSVLTASLSASLILSGPAMGSIAFATTDDIATETSSEIIVDEEPLAEISEETSIDLSEDADYGEDVLSEIATEEELQVVEIEDNEAEVQPIIGDSDIAVYASTDVAINAKNFPDANFRQYVLDEIDTDGNGILSVAEISACTYISCTYDDIYDLTGIEIFKNLKTLYCNNNNLSNLDVSKNTALESLYCDKNNLSSLNVSKNTCLTSLGCGDNHLTSLDVSKNTALNSLYCYNNNLTSLNVSKNIALEYLYCYGNKISSIDTSKNTELKNFVLLNSPTINSIKETTDGVTISWVKSHGAFGYYIYRCENGSSWEEIGLVIDENNLSFLDKTVDKGHTYKYSVRGYFEVPEAPNVLSDFDENGKSITVQSAKSVRVVIDEKTFPDPVFRQYILKYIDKDGNGIINDAELTRCTSIGLSDVSSLKGIEVFYNLTYLKCSGKNLSSLDVSKNVALRDLECYDCNLSNLDLSKNTELTWLNCFNNKLTSLDVSKNTKLINLGCYNNNLTSLKLGKNKDLRYLDCYNNKLTSLDVSGCTSLYSLECGDNKLTSLDVTNNHLAWLFCWNNNLTSLKLGNVVELSCSNNNLTSLDLSTCSGLNSLKCAGNNLSSLDISKNTELWLLNCSSNSLTNLNVSKNTKLSFLFCYGNQIKSVDTKNNKELTTFILLNTPTVNTPTKVSNGVKLSWSKSIGANGYYIYRREAGGSWKRLAEVKGVDTLSYIDKATSNNKIYEYTIRGYWDNDGDIYLSDYEKNGKSITLGTPTLATPKLSGVENVNGGVKISWGKVAGAAKYRVYYKTGSGKWTKIADTTSTSYTWKKAQSGIKYTFTVRCLSSDGKSFTSSYDSKGKSITYVAAPKLSSVSNTASGVKISWGKVTGAAKYRVYYKTGSGKWTKIADTTSTSYTWKKAQSGTEYTFTVRCLSSDGKSFTSSYDSKGKSITYVAAPKLSGVSNTTSGVKISWGKVTGAEKYRIYYKSGSEKWTKVADTTSTSYTWKGAKKGTTYTFTVRCMSSDGKSFTSSYDSTGKKITYTGK